MMNCKRVKMLLPAYAAGELSETEYPLVETHLAECNACRSALAGFQSIGGQLALLQTVPVNTDIIETTLSRLKSAGMSWYNRFPWPRFAFFSAAAIILVFVITTLLALPAQAPGDFLAQALTNTQNVKSLRVYDFAEKAQPGINNWFTNYYLEADCAASGELHVNKNFTSSYSDNLAEWERQEYIIYDNIVYYSGTVKPPAFKTEYLQDNGKLLEMIQQPADSLRLLVDTTKMPNEKIDGIPCFQYRSQVDKDAWVEKQMADLKAMKDQLRDDAIGMNQEWSEAYEKSLESLLRSWDVILEYWIGVDDNLVHQWRMTQIIDKGDSSYFRNMRETIKYFDFNMDIVVEPPLDSTGNLLLGWQIREGQ
jgi:hypothetical protein